MDDDAAGATMPCMSFPTSARELTAVEWELVELARITIDANTDAGADEDGVHTMGAAVRTEDGHMFGLATAPTLMLAVARR